MMKGYWVSEALGTLSVFWEVKGPAGVIALRRRLS